MSDLSNLTAKDINTLNEGEEYEGELELHSWNKDRPIVVEDLGTFWSVDEWNLGDGREMGEVVKHEESGKFFMRTGYYSSWDSSDWETGWLEAKPYEFVETRYEPK